MEDSMIDHMLDYKTSLNRFQRTEKIPSSFETQMK